MNQNVSQLNKESASQKSTIAEQDQTIHEANYLVGTRKALKEAKVISRQGLFCPPIVSSQAQDADFKSIDVRQTKSIALESKKAKVLSVHPSDSYTLEPGEDGMLVLKIQDENAFWKENIEKGLQKSLPPRHHSMIPMNIEAVRMGMEHIETINQL